MSNIIAIVGRPNVGKSTLFNRLIEQRKAIMDNMSGVTRDRHYGYGQWTGKFFTVIDTGGYVHGSEDIFEGAIREQVDIGLHRLDVGPSLVEFGDVLVTGTSPATLLFSATAGRTVSNAISVPAGSTGLRLELERQAWLRLGRDVVGQRTAALVAKNLGANSPQPTWPLHWAPFAACPKGQQQAPLRHRINLTSFDDGV